MGISKRRYEHITSKLSGDCPFPALSGGFINIYKDGKSLFIANVPSPNLLAERSSDSVIENWEDFEDDDAQYEIFISSSVNGVYWELNIKAKDSKKQLELEYKFTTKYEPYYE